MGSGKNLLGLAIMFFVFAIVFSILFWFDVSTAAKIGMFVLGFGTGGTFGGWIASRDGKSIFSG